MPEERAGDALESSEPAVQDAVAGEVVVTLSAPRSSLAARDSVLVEVTLTNVSSRSVRVLKWHTPVDGVKEDLFRVTADGASAEYNGRHYKWATPEAHDFLTLAPGERVSRTVDLASIYDLSKTATYSIRYDSEAHHDASHEGVSQLRSDSLSVFVEGRPFVHPEAAAAGTVTAQALSTANCSSTRITAVTTAFNSARTYANDAVSHLTNTTQGNTSRYRTWFGTYSSTGWSTVTSHFTVVADTDDWAYGQSACKNLAISNVTRARDNADSHEYFAENTPALP